MAAVASDEHRERARRAQELGNQALEYAGAEREATVDRESTATARREAAARNRRTDEPGDDTR